MKTKIKFRLTPSAIFNDKRKELTGEASSGDIYWMIYTLKNVYGIKLSFAKARRLAKQNSEMAVDFSEAKHLILNWNSVNKLSLPKILTEHDEVHVKMEQI